MKKRNEFFLILNSMSFLLFALVLSVSLTGCASTEKQVDQPVLGKKDGMPVNLEGKHLSPGLKALYFHDKFRHINDMPKTESGIAKFGRSGPPIPMLNHSFGSGKVFESGRSQEIGILMNGYLHLDKPGKYLFQAKTNDGFQLFVDGNLIVSDPGVHGDRLSETGEFFVSKGGMFPVEIKYFQRKGSATVILYWQPPGSGFSVVPSKAYSHIDQ